VRRLDDLVVYHPDSFEPSENIQIRTGAEAAAIEHAQREVGPGTGERIKYDKLVIATARVRIRRAWAGQASQGGFPCDHGRRRRIAR